MGVPDFQSFFKPLLEFAADGEEHSIREAREVIARSMSLSEADLSELLPSGTQTKFDNRVAWARSYFVQAKVIESTRRGYFRITDRGRELLAKRHSRIDIRILDQYPEFVDSILRAVTTTAKLLAKLPQHRPKHQKRLYRKHTKTFEMNCVQNC